MSNNLTILASSICIVLLHGSCADRGPVWSLSRQAIADIGEGHRGPKSGAPTKVATPENCDAVLRLHLSASFSAADFAPGLPQINVDDSERVDLDCHGGCADTLGCKVHHTIHSPDPHHATTGCICEPRSPPPCRLTVQWALDADGQRLIEKVSCGDPAGREDCGLRWRFDEGILAITCDAAVRAPFVDKPQGRR